MNKLFKNLSLQTKSVLKKVTVVTLCMVVVGVCVFYACQKKSELSDVATEEQTVIPIQKQAYPPRYYKMNPCYLSGCSDCAGYKCDQVTYQASNACDDGYPCKAPIIGMVHGYFMNITSEMPIPSVSKRYVYRIYSEILRDHYTHVGIMLYCAKFDVIDKENENIKASWNMVLKFTEDARDELGMLIGTDNPMMQDIASSFNSYITYVNGILLTPTFSQNIHVVDGEDFVINYDYIRGEIWEHLVNLLN